MLFFGLDDGERFHEPEIYYTPKFRPEFHKVIFDPNWISNIGSIRLIDVFAFFKEMGIKIDAVMAQKASGKDSALQRTYFDYTIDTEYIQMPTLEDFCDLIYSAKAIYCFVTGTATLCAALGKSANVLVGTEQPYICPKFLHSPLHKYYNIFPIDTSGFKPCSKRVWRFKIFDKRANQNETKKFRANFRAFGDDFAQKSRKPSVRAFRKRLQSKPKRHTHAKRA